jgi:hypothetical protein
MVHSCELASSLVVKQFDKQGDCLQRGSMSVVGLANAGRRWTIGELARRWQCCCTSLLCDADA